MNEEKKYKPEIFDKLKEMDSEDIRLLYEQYSEWSRHFHNQILTFATFGLTVSLGSLSFAFNPEIGSIQFNIIGFSTLLLLLICHKFINSIKIQQANYLAILDYIEAYWKIRERNTNMFGPLTIVTSKFKPGSTGRQRRNLYILTGSIWMVAALLKIFSIF